MMPIAFIILLTINLTSLWFIRATWQRFSKTSVSFRWRLPFLIVCLLGLAVGAWAGVVFEYHAKPTMRIAGFPLPGAFFILEDGRWTDFVPPRPMALAAVIGNILLSAAIFLFLFRIVCKLFGDARPHLTSPARSLHELGNVQGSGTKD